MTDKERIKRLEDDVAFLRSVTNAQTALLDKLANNADKTYTAIESLSGMIKTANGEE